MWASSLSRFGSKSVQTNSSLRSRTNGKVARILRCEPVDSLNVEVFIKLQHIYVDPVDAEVVILIQHIHESNKCTTAQYPFSNYQLARKRVKFANSLSWWTCNPEPPFWQKQSRFSKCNHQLQQSRASAMCNHLLASSKDLPGV